LLAFVRELLIEVGLDRNSSSRQPSEQAKNSKESERAAQPISPICQLPHRALDAVA
jgi:hypothetical protein